MTIKLSRYIEDELRTMETDKNDTKDFLASMKEEDYHKIGIDEMEKIIKAPSDKSYYNKKLVEESYHEVKQFLLDLKERGKLKADDISDEDYDKLINACSFSLNSVHYLMKFKKSKNMLHPIDLLYILSKIDQP